MWSIYCRWSLRTVVSRAPVLSGSLWAVLFACRRQGGTFEAGASGLHPGSVAVLEMPAISLCGTFGWGEREEEVRALEHLWKYHNNKNNENNKATIYWPFILILTFIKILKDKQYHIVETLSSESIWKHKSNRLTKKGREGNVGLCNWKKSKSRVFGVSPF